MARIEGLDPDRWSLRHPVCGLAPSELALDDASASSVRPPAAALGQDGRGAAGVVTPVAPERSLDTPWPISEDLTPQQYVELFRSMTVPYFDLATGARHEATADVHIYTNDSIARRRSNMEELSSLQSAIRAEARRPAGRRRIAAARAHNVAARHTFTAKGSLAEVRMTLGYALTFGRCTDATLQTFCDNRAVAGIGLDCSGLVCGYLLATGRIARERWIPSFRNSGLARAGVRRAGAAATGAARALDVLVWERSDAEASNHIAIIDRLGTEPDTFVVCESSGSKEGLAVSTYTVVNAAADGVVPGGMFRVDRGAGGGGVNNVRIYGVAYDE